MATEIDTSLDRMPLYTGLRMTSDEYYELDDDGFRYELISGVLIPAYPPVEILNGEPPVNHGVRMTAEEYLDSPDDGYRYELINGVLFVSPSPTPKHQRVAAEILFQLMLHLREHSCGEVFPETDVRFEDETCYKPELVFLRTDVVRDNLQRIRTVPDMVCEIISPESRKRDSVTKLGDYERFGAPEYWLIDPKRDAMTFYRLHDGKYAEIETVNERYASESVPGFELDLAAVRKSFRPA